MYDHLAIKNVCITHWLFGFGNDILIIIYWCCNVLRLASNFYCQRISESLGTWCINYLWGTSTFKAKTHHHSISFSILAYYLQKTMIWKYYCERLIGASNYFSINISRIWRRKTAAIENQFQFLATRWAGACISYMPLSWHIHARSVGPPTWS